MHKKKKFLKVAALITFVVLTTGAGAFMWLFYEPPMPVNLPYGISKDSRFLAGIIAQSIDAKLFKSDCGNVLPFLMSSPLNIQDGKTYPLVIFLHGSSHQGTNNRRQFERPLHNGIKKHAPDSFVIYPQAKSIGFIRSIKDLFVRGKCFLMQYNWDGFMGQEYNYSFMVYRLLDYIFDNDFIPADINRIYLIGYSMGGFGVTWFINDRPDFFAAAAVIAGRMSRMIDPDPEAFINIPMWIAHGKRDTIVDFESGSQLADFVTNAGNKNVVFDVHENRGHSIQRTVFGNPEFYTWLFSHCYLPDKTLLQQKLSEWVQEYEEAHKILEAVKENQSGE